MSLKKKRISLHLVSALLSLFCWRAAVVAQQKGKPLIEAVSAGDKLVSIDKQDIKGWSLASVIDALRGKPGSKHMLGLERNGKQLTIDAPVVRIF